MPAPEPAADEPQEGAKVFKKPFEVYQNPDGKWVANVPQSLMDTGRGQLGVTAFEELPCDTESEANDALAEAKKRFSESQSRHMQRYEADLSDSEE